MTNGITDQTKELKSIAELLLDPQLPAHTLRPEILAMKELLQAPNSPQDDIATGETRTAEGLALSPTMAAMCIEDYLRTIQFIRGTRTAIDDLRKQFTDRPIRILYAGCGPLAILALPLMVTLSEHEVQFTLIDLHAESIKSTQSIVEGLGLSGRVEQYETGDAMAYHLPTGHPPPDLILMEIMQACLEAEPQVAVARHLLPQAPQAILIPEEVRIELKLVDPSCEFDLEGLGENHRERIPLGTVFSLSKESIELWGGLSAEQLPAATVRYPDSIDPRFQPMLFTYIQIYGNYALKEYESGLTCPKRLELEPYPSDFLRFNYELGSYPRLCCKTDKSINCVMGIYPAAQ